MRKCVVVALTAAVAGLGSACATSPGAPPAAAVVPAAVNPVGTFDFTTAVETTSVNGTLTITRTDTGYGGSVTSTVTEPMPVRGVAVDGQKLTVTAETPDGPLLLVMAFQGDDFTGTWTLGEMTGTYSGKRRTP